MPAGSVYAAPVGTKLGDAGWKLIGTTVDGVTTTESFTLSSDRAQLLTLQDRVNRALIGSEWAANGWKPAGFANETPVWLRNDLRPYLNVIDEAVASMASAQLGGFRQRFMAGAIPVTLNERSKPVSLTKYHTYTDNEGDSIRVEHDGPEGVVAYLDIDQVDGNDGVYVTPEFSIPLALNVLGYDRMEALGGFTTTIGEATSHGVLVSSPQHRDRVLSIAVAYLKSVDRYDQREAAKAFEAKVAAKRAAEYAKYKQESFDKAKSAYAAAVADQFWRGIDAESTAKVQAALSAYETARRKLEGLPN